MKQVSLNIFNLIVEIGTVQGILMTLVLYFLPVKNNSKTLFSFILLTLSLLSFKILLHTLGLWNMVLFHFFPLAIDTTLPPLLYLYICSITTVEFKFKKTILYFIPTIVFMLYAIVVYTWAFTIQDTEIKEQLAKRLLFNQVKNTEDFIAVISAIFYWVFGYKRIGRYRKWLFDTQSDSRLQELTWLKNLLIISGIMVLFLTIVVLLEDLSTGTPHHFIHLQIFYTYLALITYYLSLKGYSLYSFSKPFNLMSEKLTSPQVTNTLSDGYLPKDSVVTEENEDYLIIKDAILNSLKNDRIYLNQELNIKQMAQHVGYPVAVVSATINQSFGMNFRNLVNQYRVNEFKERSVDPPSHLSLFGIALECGFNSEASFFRIFRQETGLSPNDYIQKNRD